MKETKFVIVVDYVDGQTLNNCYLLGWDCKTDWFNTNIYGSEILNDDGTVKKHKFNWIDIDNNSCAYVGETFDDCLDPATDALKEDYYCIICKLEKVDDDYNLIPIDYDE